MADTLGPVDTSFRTAIRRLDAAGRLVKVSRSLSLVDDVAGVMKALDGGPALLFESAGGHPIPILGNFLSCDANAETALSLDREEMRIVMQRAIETPLAPVGVEDGPVREVVIDGDDVDLGEMLPVLRHTPDDSGRFITAGVVVVADPQSGVHNASYHRLQLLDERHTAIRLDYGRHLRHAYENAQAAGVPLPIAVCLGTDVALMYAGAYMGSQMPLDADELSAAGGLRGEPLELVRCVSQPLAVPASTEIVLEGVVHPDRLEQEGPFGEFVGYLSDSGPAPVFEVTALTMRRDPLYHAINGAGRETIVLRKHVLEAAALRALRQATPIVTDVELTAGGLHRFHLVVKVAKRSERDEGLQRNAMLAAIAALKDLDRVIVVDDDIDITNVDDVEYAVATRVEGSRDIMLLPGTRGHEYVRVSDGGIRTKVCIDATVPYDQRERFSRVEFTNVDIASSDTSTEPGSARVPWLGGADTG
jgi:2,5-furandicarboxylate decarboxylase 1